MRCTAYADTGGPIMISSSIKHSVATPSMIPTAFTLPPAILRQPPLTTSLAGSIRLVLTMQPACVNINPRSNALEKISEINQSIPWGDESIPSAVFVEKLTQPGETDALRKTSCLIGEGNDFGKTSKNIVQFHEIKTRALDKYLITGSPS